MEFPNTTIARVFEKSAYKDGKYEIVSIVAYLIGVEKRIFELESESPRLEIYEKLQQNKAARIIRNLCILRTAIEQNFKAINDKMQHEYLGLASMPALVPAACIRQLDDDGVTFIKKSSTMAYQHVVEINRLIMDRINNCKELFPLWLKWEYVKDMFIMPNGLTKAGTQEAANTYYTHKYLYPYRMYINWVPNNDWKFLQNDQKFVTTLYQWHNDYFVDYSNVSDVGIKVKSNIYDFLDQSYSIVMAVDCENSDPYKLYSTLKNLDEDYTKKISKIILFDDVHSASAWRILEEFTQIPVEHILIERLKQNKSLVDITLTARACKEHYTANVDSFIIVSSDSDYWGLISSMPSAKFLVMVERDACGPDMKEALFNSGIFYCYIDDFYSGNAEDIKLSALFREMYRHLDQALTLNVNTMFDEALKNTRINMSPAERKQFFEKYLRQMSLVIDENGDARIELRKK